MFNYFQLDSDNRVINQISMLTETEFPEIFFPVPDEYLGVDLSGKVWDAKTNTFRGTIDNRTFIKATLDKEFYKTSDTIKTTLDIKDSADNLVPVNGTYFVPILRTSDGFQAAFIQLTLVEGHAETSFNIPTLGIYTINLDRCYPVPTSVMQGNITFVVTA